MCLDKLPPCCLHQSFWKPFCIVMCVIIILDAIFLVAMFAVFFGHRLNCTKGYEDLREAEFILSCIRLAANLGLAIAAVTFLVGMMKDIPKTATIFIIAVCLYMVASCLTTIAFCIALWSILECPSQILNFVGSFIEIIVLTCTIFAANSVRMLMKSNGP